jgi:uncharacterized protein
MSRFAPLLMVLMLCVVADAGPPSVTGLPGLRVKLLSEHDGWREYQLVFEPRTEIMGALTDFVLRNNIKAAHYTALGACTDAVIGYYDPAVHDYRRTPYAQQMEIVSLIGDAAPTNGGAGLHAHIGLGLADGTMRGGHLFEAHAFPTLEMHLIASPTPITRKHDNSMNLELLAP